MILGEIDLSIGAMYMFAPIVFYKLDNAGLGLVPCVLLALLVCMAVGAVNGAFVAIVGVSSFVTTLGMLFTFEGLSLILSHGKPVATPGAADSHDRQCRFTTSSTGTASRCPKRSTTSARSRKSSAAACTPS